jgi:integrase
VITVPTRLPPCPSHFPAPVRRAGRYPISPKGPRDRALLLLGFAGAFRRSELVALDVADVDERLRRETVAESSCCVSAS